MVNTRGVIQLIKIWREKSHTVNRRLAGSVEVTGEDRESLLHSASERFHLGELGSRIML